MNILQENLAKVSCFQTFKEYLLKSTVLTKEYLTLESIRYKYPLQHVYGQPNRCCHLLQLQATSTECQKVTLDIDRKRLYLLLL